MINKFEASSVILRVMLGVIFFTHGFVKFQGGIENTVGWFESIGLPGVLAYGAGFLEVAGGIALILGLGTKFVSTLFVLLMAGAIFKAKLAGGFLGNGQGAGYELDLALLAMALYLAINGSRRLAVDSFILKGNAAGDNQKTA